MKQLNQLINYLLLLIGIRHNIVSVIVHNNYLVYCKDTYKYYNLTPLKVNQLVLYKGSHRYKIESINTHNLYTIVDVYDIKDRTIASGNDLYPYKPDSTVRGYIKGINFIVVQDKEQSTSN